MFKCLIFFCVNVKMDMNQNDLRKFARLVAREMVSQQREVSKKQLELEKKKGIAKRKQDILKQHRRNYDYFINNNKFSFDLSDMDPYIIMRCPDYMDEITKMRLRIEMLNTLPINPSFDEYMVVVNSEIVESVESDASDASE